MPPPRPPRFFPATLSVGLTAGHCWAFIHTEFLIFCTIIMASPGQRTRTGTDPRRGSNVLGVASPNRSAGPHAFSRIMRIEKCGVGGARKPDGSRRNRTAPPAKKMAAP